MARRLREREEVFGETLTPTQSHPVVYETERSTGAWLANLIYSLLTILEVGLLLRLLLMLFGANPANGFVSAIYTLTYPFVVPFYGVFGQAPVSGASMSQFDIATLLAMVVYALAAWILIRLIAVFPARPMEPLE